MTVAQFCAAFGANATSPEVERLFGLIDEDGSGTVDCQSDHSKSNATVPPRSFTGVCVFPAPNKRAAFRCGRAAADREYLLGLAILNEQGTSDGVAQAISLGFKTLQHAGPTPNSNPGPLIPVISIARRSWV